MFRTEKDHHVDDSVPTTSTALKIVSLEDDEAKELYKQLLKKRQELAATSDCMPYMVASNETLMKISIAKPEDIETLRNLKCEILFCFFIYKYNFCLVLQWTGILKEKLKNSVQNL